MGAQLRERMGGLAWLLPVLAVAVEVPAAMAWQPAPYDPLGLTISDLGATTCTVLDYPKGPVSVCSPLHGLVNAVTILGGIAILVGGVLLRRLAAPGLRRRAFVTLLVVTGLSWAGAAAVPVDRDLDVHALLALPTFLTHGLALLLIDREPGPGRRWRRMARWIGWWGVLGTVLLLVAQQLGLPVGLVERATLYPVVVYSAVLGLTIGLSRGRAASR